MTTTTLQRLLGLGLRGGVATHGGANRRNMLLLIQLRWLAVAGQVATILLVQYVMRIPLPVRARAIFSARSASPRSPSPKIATQNRPASRAAIAAPTAAPGP